MQEPAEYAILDSAMAQARAPVAASELHGGMCGLLCAGGASMLPAWVEECLGGAAAGEEAAQVARDRIRELEACSWRSLNGPELEFFPLLPDDDTALDRRVEALASWCRGFVSGLGLAGFALDTDGTADGDRAELEEIVGDFSEIGRAGLSAEELESEDEAGFALAEVVEYVRVSVQIVFEGLEPSRSGDAGSAAVH